MPDNLPTRTLQKLSGDTAMPALRSADLSAIVGRIENTIEEETAGIRTNPDFDIRASNARKSRYLYELNKAARNINLGEISPEQREQLSGLRDKLAANEAVIRAHINAVTEVAALIQKTIQRAETDGTYSAHEFGGSRIPS
jgi:hypothetical protein